MFLSGKLDDAAKFERGETIWLDIAKQNAVSAAGKG
jgi:hypothetical protein